MLNTATIAAIVAACWAHPSGVSYLEKIERLNACQTENPCCVHNVIGGGGKRRSKDTDTHRLYSDHWEYLDGLREIQVQVADDIRGATTVHIPLDMALPAEIAEIAVQAGQAGDSLEHKTVASIIGNPMALAMLAIMLSELDD